METNITKRLNYVNSVLNQQKVARLAYDVFLRNTPVAKVNGGNAKRSTRLESDRVINADYNYAEVLNKGRGYRDGQMRGSDQAPQGMTKPMIEAVRDYVTRSTQVEMSHYGDY